MLKNYRNRIILTSVVILLPLFMGLVMWDRLPDMMPTHWGLDGTADGFSNKLTGIVLMPLILLALHIFCLWITLKTNRHNGQSEKILNLTMWIMPVLSLFTSYTMYSAAMSNNNFGPERTTPMFIGLMFLVIGNYLPKTRMNSTIGIKIPTTYSSEANWNATHRIGGRLWVMGGFITMTSSAFDEEIMVWTMLITVLLMVLIPMAYSYIFYCREKKEGKEVTTKRALPLTPAMLMFRRVMLAGVALLIVFIIFIMFTGDIRYEYFDGGFTVNASYWSDMTVDYDSIDSVEYREDFKVGIRTYGFGSARLSLGTFKNDELGTYTLYAYTGADAHIVMENDGKYLVISAKTLDETKELYQKILAETGK